MKRLTLTFACLLFGLAAFCRPDDFGGTVRFDRTIHDFGSILAGDGPVSCSFSVSNISSKPVTITAVVSSCGCTDVKWTRKALNPGETGRIDASYSNDEGAYPFDKTLTVYISDLRKPVILHIRGVAVDRKKPLSETYPVHYGPLAVRSSSISAGTMLQGEQRSGEVTVANISDKAVKLEFTDVSPGLNIRCKDAVIPAGGCSSVVFTVSSDPSHWGKCWYYATPLVDGSAQRSSGRERKPVAVLGAQAIVDDENPELAEGSTRLGFWTVTKDNFAALTTAQLAQAPVLDFKQTTVSFGKARAGARFVLSFPFSNTGKEDLQIYKVDSPSAKLKAPVEFETVAAGAGSVLNLDLNTAGLQPGERLFVVNVYSNSPSKSIVTLYVTGIVE